MSLDQFRIALLAANALLLLSILICVLLHFFTTRKKKRMSNMIPPEEPVPMPIDVSSDAEHKQPPVTDRSDSGINPPSIDIPAAKSEISDKGVPTEVVSREHSSVIPSSVSDSSKMNIDPPDDILAAFGQLAKDFETKLKYDASKQELIDKLYKENMEFKEGIIKKFQYAMILAVIEKIDEADKDIAVFEKRDFSEENYRKLIASYRDITAGFQDMLSSRFDVECYSGEVLTRFEPKTQRSLKTCPTAEADKNKLVKQTLRPGYKTADGFILRPELVEVYVFDEKR